MSQATAQAVHPGSTKRVVARNVLSLVLAQLVGTPLSLAVNATMARHIGPEDFGHLYLALTFVSFGFLAVDWGQSGTLPALVAQDRTKAGELLGSGLAWRAVAVIGAYGLLALVCAILGYPAEFQIVLALVVLTSTISTVTAACQDVVRGFERTDVVAAATIGGQIGLALFVVPTLLLGGKLRAVLLAQTVSTALVLAYIYRVVKPIVGAIRVRKEMVKRLLTKGWGFLFLGLAMVLQPNVDGVFLSKMAPADTVGWYAAARKLVGILIFPSSTLMVAIYPTLCRLFADDREGYVRATSSALRIVTIIGVPVTVACIVYPDVGIRIFSRQSFGPAADDLRFLSVFVLLVYSTMIMGISLMAAGQQRAWASVQLVCVLISVVFDPLLVPWFQLHKGNGGLGLCATSVVSEVFMLGCGWWLMPRGVLDRKLRRDLVVAFTSGGVMIGVAMLLSRLSPFLAGPVALGAYAGCLFLLGGVDKEQVQMLRGIVRRKMA
jgi:PST family polysaccharide transporter